MKKLFTVGTLAIVGLTASPTLAADNIALLKAMKENGATVRPLSAEEGAAIQGASWKLVRQLMTFNVKLYGKVGWEIGRMLSIRQYRIDPGPYPGLNAALTGRY